MSDTFDGTSCVFLSTQFCVFHFCVLFLFVCFFSPSVFALAGADVAEVATKSSPKRYTRTEKKETEKKRTQQKTETLQKLQQQHAHTRPPDEELVALACRSIAMSSFAYVD